MITLPDPKAIQALFDFKGIFEPAFVAVFKLAGFESGQLIDSSVLPDFQAPTPRLELKMSVGAATKQAFGLVNGIRVNATWKGTLTVRAITAAKKEGKIIHAAYRAQVCLVGNVLAYLVNNQAFAGGNRWLANHKIHDPVTQTGESDVFTTSDGFEYSDQTFGFDFDILPKAFATLGALAVNPMSP